MTATITVNGLELPRWKNYSVSIGMLTEADSFSLALAPANDEVIETVPPDAEVEVAIDGVRVITGRIEDRVSTFTKESGSALAISGNDRVKRMMDSAAELGTFPRLSILDLGTDLAQPFFPAGAILSNAENRDLIRGRRSGKAAAGTEPVISRISAAPKKVEPGQSRWDVLQEFLEPANLVAWSETSGDHLIIGQPNYTQESQFRFLLAAPGSRRFDQSNVISATVNESVANMYSRVIVSGAARGSGSRYGKQMLNTTAEVRDDFRTADGTGINFRQQKVLRIADEDVKSVADAAERAARHYSFRAAERLVIELVVQGHSQQFKPSNPEKTLFAHDLMADVEIEAAGIADRFLITDLVFTNSKEEGSLTSMKLVPEGTLLTM